MDPGLDPRLRDPTGVGLRPGPPATPTQVPKPLATTHLPSHPSQAAQAHAQSQSQSQSQTQSQQGNPNVYQQHHHHQQHALPSYAHGQHSHSAHSQTYPQAQAHPHALAQTPSPPYTHASHGSHGSSSYTPQNTLTPIGTGNGNGGGHQQQQQTPQQQQQQQTPQQQQRGGSSGPVTPEGNSGDPNDPKKQRACESCRGLKVRCEPDATNPEGPCKRCAKAGRACVVTQPTRKRQKKTDNRVAELEKKIDALTASLQATRGGAPHPMSSPEVGSVSASGADTTGGPLGRGAEGSTVSATSDGGGGSGPGLGTTSLAVRDWASQVRETVRERSSSTGQRQSASQNLSSYGTIDINIKEYSPPGPNHKRKHGDEDMKNVSIPPLQPPEDEPPDVVDRCIITMAQADELYKRYTEQMAPHLPAVVFPPEMTAADLRATKPILFHAVMAAASSEWPSIQKVLTKELMQVFADKVIVFGQKSLELVQALHVAVIWYWPPENFEELKFYQLVHVSAIMAIDIGLGRRKQAKGGFRKHMPGGPADHPLKKNAPPDPTALEARRTWMACYFLATNTSMALHRPNLVRWTPFMAECVDVLQSSPDAAPTDKYFCHMIFTHKLAEEVGVLLSMDDPASMPSISDSRTQYALKGFERDMDRYKSQLPPDMLKPTLRMAFNVLNLYMHEIATHNDFQVTEDFKQMPPNADTFRETYSSVAPLTPAHINAISACLAAIDGIFEVFVSLDPLEIRCLPVYNFVRVAYAVVVLIKMYFAAASPKSELGKVISKDNMRVEMHLEKLLAVFHAVAADNKSRPATKFMLVLVMLRSWFHKQKQNQPGAAGPSGDNMKMASAADGISIPSQAERNCGAPPARSSEYPTTNTPLQLLSEVATNENAATPRTTNPDLLPSVNSNTGPWYNNHAPGGSRPPPQAYGMYDHDTPASAGADSGPSPATNLVSAGMVAMNPGPQEPQPSGFVVPWLNNNFAADFDYATLGDDFAQAMDWSLEELADGNLGSGMESGMRYFMSEPPWFSQMQQNMALGAGMVDSMGVQGGSVPPGPQGGMYPY
ncbi:putative fungal-specific transcription protein [Podospora aff. communis PSN243]|uniref:Fungal-specific transcription protein n=1 Tax=Podospora aff. communis PSN243 TaxID=3040156 RepID=A0AAV9GGI9_9PEZI|nr:putative fungal-specific transcription protein [Podospora aff. communis PSN243]